ncbi:polyketide synthase PksN [Aquimarina sp. EL_43]|uniref:SDR family NAD(P)-dependent oxidoreductase n=1 Tax=unclassified Aquimarina TaxID=2627091 RepID=UPI0018CBD7B1|nr:MULTISPECIES: SDR family NAD(P)-dependent oxidoreductase [unclassified Aquimarina]MBG6133277.1 polyketide synthase PksN [Aquimarina sp. EL_35]MBG6153364.1 polyketide synthase PksN [Aquimarina sp. EL_32]MBG6171591.1 polyketide synthase PksN [Aquimarina sp. EL_43]
MIDFIEYIVLELKSKRLSKANALDLIKQFSHHTVSHTNRDVIHPLLHKNTSDLSQQSFSTIFNGKEPFLRDHVVKDQKVLPGVAYLEMARMALRKALPFQEESIVELRNIIWAQPIIVQDPKEVTIALFADETEIGNGQINYEVYSTESQTEEGVKETIHCQGQAVYINTSKPVRLDIDKLKMRMQQGELKSAPIYAVYSKLGLNYGPTYRGIKTIFQDNEQLLAQLELNEITESNFNDYILHPGLMDSALQSAIGLFGGLDQIPDKPSLPFALESLKVFSGCTKEMFAWVRYAKGNKSTDKITKLDIDLCNQEGEVAIQMRGFSSRILNEDSVTKEVTVTEKGALYGAPVWQVTKDMKPFSQNGTDVVKHRYVFLCEVPRVDTKQLESLLTSSKVIALQNTQQKNIAERFNEYARICFEQLRILLSDKLQEKVFIQIVTANKSEQPIFTGLSALIKTATLENPKLTGQVIVTHPKITAEELILQLEENQNKTQDTIIKYEQETRQVLRWKEIPVVHNKPKIVFKDNGVYLITGGLGNLGKILVREILKQTQNAKIIVTGRSELTEEKQTLIDKMGGKAGQLSYKQLDVVDLNKVKQIITSIKKEYKGIHGIIHSAGMISDNFILKKTSEEFSKVLAPKVLGTYNLDEASKNIDLDFLVLFSSISSITGNGGQADYATANDFMNQFGIYRNKLVGTKQRSGKTMTINWPLWEEGGMKIDQSKQEMLEQSTGMLPMCTETGVHAFYRSFELTQDQLLVVEGNVEKLHQTLFNDNASETSLSSSITSEKKESVVETDEENLEEKTQNYIKKQLSELFKLPSHKIDPLAPLEKYGIDSILAMNLTNQLEKTFGSLPKTLFFEYQTIHELTDYFINSHLAKLTSLFTSASEKNSQEKNKDIPIASPIGTRSEQGNSRGIKRSRKIEISVDKKNNVDTDPIAIIGLSGRYPKATNIEAYWNNLRDGKDCITEVPKNRWDWQEYYSPDRSKSGYHYSKWGGFIDGVDEFDPLFFNISPLEAEILDPQERLFLQHTWMAIEDAGYTKAGLQIPHKFGQPGQVGVYAGVMYSEYQLYGIEASKRGHRIGVPGSYASIANRVSYVLNLHGPSMTVDSMCSSSLTAIHLACQDLKQGRTSLGIAGGVNVSIHPNKYTVISAGQYISSEGHCQSFGEGGEGYIPGEGVGVVVLKKLSEAEKDGDHIYGIINGSTLNHGGKTNGYSVPNPKAQSNLISNVLKETDTDPRRISYIEAHGTGTKLGDPIEISALSKAFKQSTSDVGFCLLGSAKSNIGHCESAAGIAGLTKVLLQLKHQQIVPSLHSKKLNPNIDFEKTPFIVNQTLRTWEEPIIDGIPQPRIAGVSSFGAGGANAHIIVQEYVAPAKVSQPKISIDLDSKVIVPLSARTPDQLKQKAIDLYDFLQKSKIEKQKQAITSIDLTEMAYTLQVGRETMDMRLGFMVNSVEELIQKLKAYINGEKNIEDTYQGHTDQDKDTLLVFNADVDFEQTVDKWIARRKLPKLLDLWVKGLNLDWNKFYEDNTPKRISLPAYPFSKDKYWIDIKMNNQSTVDRKITSVLHPLLHSNTSDLSKQSYSSIFSGEEFFLADHQVKIKEGKVSKVLPAVAYLEMARVAVEKVIPVKTKSSILELHNTAWTQPLVVEKDKQVEIALFIKDENQIDYEVYSVDNEQNIIHSQGVAKYSTYLSPEKLSIEQLKGEMNRGSMEAASLYSIFKSMGLIYGPAYQGITKVYQGEKQLLVQLSLPSVVKTNQNDYLLHPSVMDSSLQAAFGLIDDLTTIPSQPSVPFALETIRILSAVTEHMFAWVRYSEGSVATDTITKLDIDICDQEGNICVQMEGLSSRQLSEDTIDLKNKDIGILMAKPLWKSYKIPQISETIEAEFAEKHIILCEMSDIETSQFETSIQNSHCIQLEASQKNIAARYTDYALTCFEYVQTILKNKPKEKILVQIVITNNKEQALFSGLSGLLKTAAQENPMLTGQMILTKSTIQIKELVEQLHKAATMPEESIIKYENNTSYILQWDEVKANQENSKPVFKNQGVYLITGGLGALGILFAKEILQQARETKIIVTGRFELTEEKQIILNELHSGTGQVEYQQLDLNSLKQVEKLIATIKKENGKLNGIIHSAGMISDNFILKKTNDEFCKVLAPKVTGTYNLDQASKDIDLDFLVLFSSLSGAMGNLGQSDYATANAFMDQFARYRNQLVDQKLRQGHTLSINWPLWESGNLSIAQKNIEMLWQETGISPMQTSSGIQTLYRSMTLQGNQVLVMEGNVKKMRSILLSNQTHKVEQLSDVASNQNVESSKTATVDSNTLLDNTINYLRKLFAEVLKIKTQELDPKAPLENYGIDSILAMRLTNILEKTFGSLSKTLFFEYQTIKSLAEFFAKTYPRIIQERTGIQQTVSSSIQDAIKKESPVSPIYSSNRFFNTTTNIKKEVAIVGLGGKYPLAENVEEFWENLKNARDCITEIPEGRWDTDRFFDPKRNQVGKSYSKWGGFISDVDKFDPLFFNISPKEAELIDPQERLFIQTAWQTIEDAGYSKESISTLGRVGVYVGVMYGQYQLYGAEAMLAGNAVVPGSSYASIANRVSYFLDLHGPSIALDTMCSSSLTAIHQACEEIRKGEIEAAIAGGVNVSIHPHKYLMLSQGNFAASDGRCRSFGEGGDGYVAGEGVGAVLLKSLDKAIEDGDHIYGVVKSSVINHGGKTNGYSVPNPNAQGDLIRESLKKAKIDPSTLGYIETHGTGTALGDPIEITGLNKAFGESMLQKQVCPIGSVKSNIGHLESAAGIAAVTKVLLQLKHKKLVPSLHATTLNPNINFKESPFYVQQELTPWKDYEGHPRRASISSFGAGGSNAHLIIEEYNNSNNKKTESYYNRPQSFVLSSRDKNTLLRYGKKMADFLRGNKNIELEELVYTSQIGRTPMNERLVIVITSINELIEKLDQWLSIQETEDDTLLKRSADELEGVFYGNIKNASSDTVTLLEGEEGKAYLKVIMEARNQEKLAKLWISGADIDWSLLYQNVRPKRISLPTYPFAKERYWITKPVFPIATNSLGIQESNAENTSEEEKKKLHYSTEWIEQNLDVSEEKSPENGFILILDTSDELFLALKKQSHQYFEGNTYILLKPGSVFEEIEPSVFTIDLQKEEHFKQFVEHLSIKGQLPYRIIHNGLEAASLDKKENITHQLNYSIYTLFNLCKVLIEQKHQIPLQILSIFLGGTNLTVPCNAALGSFFKTLTLENPYYKGKIVEVKDSKQISIVEKIRMIRNEFSDENWRRNEIRYDLRKNEQTYVRYVKELAQFTNIENNINRMPLKQNGVYIVSGGLGGLGLIVSEYLVKNYQSNLVLFGRSPLKAAQKEKLDRLKAYGSKILYLQADASKLEDVETIVKTAKTNFSQINGVIHSAGTNQDSFILKKSKEEIDRVLAPKIYGTINLDFATRDENLDVFIMFSSIAGVLGNIGQSDYAYGNHYLNSFAENREVLVREQKRYGKTLAINWPYWEEGGMHISNEEVTLIQNETGLCPIPVTEGIQFLEEFLLSDISQCIPLYGFPSKIRKYIDQTTKKTEKNKLTQVNIIDTDTLFENTVEYLKTLIGKEIKLDPNRIDPEEHFESFGIDSISINQINLSLERDLGDLPKTLFYEYSTIEELATYLIREDHETLIQFLNIEDSTNVSSNHVKPLYETKIQREPIRESKQEMKNVIDTPIAYEDSEPIAIIGVHGSYPQSENLDSYWESLKQGKDLTDLVPKSRWDFEEFYHEDPEKASEGKIYGKWGGFISDVDKFDPHFFNITPEEARIMDPQERLFLQSVWATIEDAGYTKESLKKRYPKAKSANVGVFVGVTTNTYNLLASEEWSKGNTIPSAHPWSIANRISYLFDFNGPSMPVDTACSSSSVAIHLACESLKKQECQVAVAGGVNLYLHPSKYHSLCKNRMVSLGGKCHSYGKGDDGFVPGEGVGSVLLKPLSKAIEDEDHIYGVLTGSAFDHSGKSNGYSAPNPNAQANLIEHTLQKAQIHPETIGYVEGHGTGTQLGDSLEIVALTNAFQKQTVQKQVIAIGSVKSNIGHPESAAGIAGVAKVLLQMKHQQLVPTINSDEVNPNINFKESPFYLQHKLTPWESPLGYPRRALINSFGAGGVNACLILEEYRKVKEVYSKQGPHLVIFSAKNEERLQEYANRVLNYIEKEEQVNLADLSFTLQVGREAMSERLAIVASNREELIIRLKDWKQQNESNHIFWGKLNPNQRRKKTLNREEEFRSLFDRSDLDKLAQLWVDGVEIDWERLYTHDKPNRISLPTYPFAKERYWVSDRVIEEKRTVTEPVNAQLHPLISYNSSTLKEVRFSSWLSDSEFYASDHQVNKEKIFPGSGFIEIANISGNLAGEQKVSKIKDIVWAHPLSFKKGSQFINTLLKPNGIGTEFKITSLDDENEQIVHSEGKLFFQSGNKHSADIENISIQKLKEQCPEPQDGSYYYTIFNQVGFNYGLAFKTIQEFYINGSFALSKLKLTDHLLVDSDRFILHPCIVDGALQTVAGLIGQMKSVTPHVPFAIDEIEIFRSLPHTCYAYVEHVEEEARSQANIKKFNIKIINEAGDVLVKIKNFYVRAFGNADVDQVKESNSMAFAVSS